MSVIIKDMEMPKTCSQCEIWSKCWDERPFWFERLEYCPLTEMADRKTESDSEIPNNCEVECEKCKHFREEADTYMKQCEYYFMECRFEPKDEPTISKMEQVEDEPQSVRSNLEPFRVDEPQTEMTTEQIVNELLSIKQILDDGKMPKQRCGNCKHLTYRFNKTWCDIKCDNPHDMVCDKWERSE